MHRGPETSRGSGLVPSQGCATDSGVQASDGLTFAEPRKRDLVSAGESEIMLRFARDSAMKRLLSLLGAGVIMMLAVFLDGMCVTDEALLPVGSIRDVGVGGNVPGISGIPKTGLPLTILPPRF